VTTIGTPSINAARAAASQANALATRPARNLPVLFVVDRDPNSLDVLLSDLSRRFGSDFMVRGDTSPETALTALQQMAAAKRPVVLLLVDEAAAGFLASAHELHPQATRVLLVDRDYSSTSPAVQAMTLGRGSIKRVASAVGEGATVVRLMHEHLREVQPRHLQTHSGWSHPRRTGGSGESFTNIANTEEGLK
jgi:hypothetical protein